MAAAHCLPIVGLPGLDPTAGAPPMESGYIEVNRSAAGYRSLFHWYVPAAAAAGDAAPLIFWLQGGPGCSSLMGLFTENGPVRVASASPPVLTLNPHSWHLRANMVYVESPAGVGFSVDTSADPRRRVPAVTGDPQTAADLDVFVRGFLSAHPALARRPVYISGESYGGHYVPQLATALLDGNSAGKTPTVPLAGLLVGNPWTDDVLDGGAVPVWLWSHALVSKPAYAAVVAACGAADRSASSRSGTANRSATSKSAESGGAFEHPSVRDYLPIRPAAIRMAAARGGGCAAATASLFSELGDDINELDVYTPCRHVEGGALHCMNYSATRDYLRTPAVQAAAHVDAAAVAAHGAAWDVCVGSGVVNYTTAAATVVPLYPRLVAALDRTMVFSGDVTFNCAFTGSEAWIGELVAARALVETARWAPWDVERSAYGGTETAGYVTEYAATTPRGRAGRFAFVTVKGAGHMVPQYQPLRAARMLDRFLAWNWTVGA